MPPPATNPAHQGDPAARQAPTPAGPKTPAQTPPPPATRTRGDACPGALRLHAADDGDLARLRLPGGILTVRQVEALATAAERYGDGHLCITSRGNAELRGIDGDHAGALAELLRHTGLLPSETHERVRNIVASPLAGLDGLGHGTLLPRLRTLDALLCGQDWTAALSGRFLFALDDGRGDVADLGADVTLLAQEGATAVVRAGSSALRVAADDAPRAALEAARAFLDAAAAAGNGAWRVRELPPGHDVDLASALARASIPAEPATVPAPHTTRPAPTPGIVAGPHGTYAVVVAPVLGRISAAQLRALPGPGGEVRITPWRGLVVPGFTEQGARERLRELEDAGFSTRPDAPWSGVGACTGRPGCAKALADVRQDALPGAGGLPVHWSGCERRCGHPHGDWVDVTATADGTYTVTVRGAHNAQNAQDTQDTQAARNTQGTRNTQAAQDTRDAQQQHKQMPLSEGELAAAVARARGDRPRAYGTGTTTR
ncbi:cobalamin biosynthesis protein CobG [Streptomyces sp. NPDC048416]|uniref:cobalamin biosynthesis protein CobG n=1 Tax=Streptomyces sp. NPDC048416 TaxID=3365546 RepID=UPI003722AEFF